MSVSFYSFLKQSLQPILALANYLINLLFMLEIWCGALSPALLELEIYIYD